MSQHFPAGRRRFLPKTRYCALALLLTCAILPLVADAQQFQVVASCGTVPQPLNVGSAGTITMDRNGTVCTNAGGGGGGAVTIANGADVALGSTTDTAGGTGTQTAISILKQLHLDVTGSIPAGTNNIGSVNQGTSPWVSSVPTWAGGTLGAMANYGTSPGAVLVPGVNAFITNSPAVTGTVTANQGTSPWIVAGGGTAGSAATGVVTVQGIASMTKLLVTPDSVALPANQSVNVAQFGGNNAVTGTGASGNGIPRVTVSNDSTVILGAGTAAIGTVIQAPTTSGGLTTFFLQPTASDNHTVVKAGAGQVYWILAENNSATVNYLRFYNATTGFNGCNSATNLVSQVQIPASTSVGGINVTLPIGIPFATGISICVTSAYATNDTTNATASAMSLTIGYN